MNTLTPDEFVARYWQTQQNWDDVAFTIEDHWGEQPWRIVFLTVNGSRVGKLEFSGKVFEWGLFVLAHADIFGTEPEPLE